MNLSGLLSLLTASSAYRQLFEALRTSQPGQRSLAVLRSARPFLVAALARDLARPILFVTARFDRAQLIYESLRAYLGAARPLFGFPQPAALFYERSPWAVEVVAERLNVLTQLVRRPDGRPVIVAGVRALMAHTLPPRELTLGTRALKTGQTLDLDKMLETWTGVGYAATTTVLSPGEFSRRGGIVDIWPLSSPAPLRIELFGDEIDSLRTFDPATQRSQEACESSIIPPANEALPRYGPHAAEQLRAWDLSRLPDDLRAQFEKDRAALAEGAPFRGIEFYLPYLYSRPATLLDYLPPEALIILDDAAEIDDRWNELEEQALELRHNAQEDGTLPPDYPVPYLARDEWRDALDEYSLLALSESILPKEPTTQPTSQLTNQLPTQLAPELPFASGQRFGGQLKTFMDHLAQLRAIGDGTLVVSRQAQRLAELWAERDHLRPPISDLAAPPAPRSLFFVNGALDDGWTLHGVRSGADQRIGLWSVHVITDGEIFGWARPQPRRRIRPRAITPEQFFADIQSGDYVVHVDHGIGIFQGLTKLTLDGVESEYLQVNYAGADRLFVPIHQADRLSKYIGATDAPPEVNRLGSADWTQMRENAQQAALEVARDLLDLYARRELTPGQAFSPDSPWQAELEAAFPYVETEDQLRAIDEVKADMEQPRPMDRLICGDVGYGKTEVALRAAFKAVQDGKQVAVLAPTTVLAQQHHVTFSARLAPFPVTVEVLSRFKSPAEQAEILNRLRAGQVDIIIGTHRLLQRDVAFKDLGLLVIDEEQRFGVTHKEVLKRMRTEVDVLTLTATPIPRTLYLSLTGVRDISTIETPPEERLPVATYVGPYDEHLVRQAILRELDRGGQVFFVHNRVMGIEQVAKRLIALVPEARIGVGHGQLNEHELERAMNQFIQGEIDVLLSTSIIESGLDIPNANTLIVDRSDHFGLAQLYQLRGRVGRSVSQAYAYFLYDPHSPLTEEARQRLEAIREASELGMGYSVAMRDLELRGAGDILGMRQSGQISAVGFGLYTKLLQRAVSELRARRAGKEPPPPPITGVTLDLPLKAYLPEAYVPDNPLRLQLYRRMGNLASMQEIDSLEKELTDRFGPPPDPVQNLIFQLRLKLMAAQARVESIIRDRERNMLVIYSDALERMDRHGLQGRIAPLAVVSRRQINLPLKDKTVDWRAALVNVLKAIAGNG
ncbi:MAG TPA: transcription-repair coupling factor [Anaerolineae bacterium]|nr:transcription-repair coupling factor [Anaerolineae bacterium]